MCTSEAPGHPGVPAETGQSRIPQRSEMSARDGTAMSNAPGRHGLPGALLMAHGQQRQ